MHSPAQYRMIDFISVTVFFVYGILLGIRIVPLMIVQPILLICAPVAGYVLADFISGVVHFLGDTVGSEKTPLIGKAFIFPFREHHTDQTAITRHSFWYTNGSNCLVSLPIMLTMYYTWPWSLASLLGAFSFVTLYFLVISVFFTNQFHKWAHQIRPRPLIRLLQRTGLVLTPKRHKLHHTPPHDAHFCITTGWLNNPLEKIGFFAFLRKIM